MNRLARLYFTGQALGWDNLPRRAWQIVKLRLKLLEKSLPAGEVSPETLRAAIRTSGPQAGAAASPATDNAWQSRAAAFSLDQASQKSISSALCNLIADADWDKHVACQVRELAADRMLWFSRHWVSVGSPPNFLHDPLNRMDWPADRHWSRYTQFMRDRADIKGVWEPSRFGWAFPLARHFVRTRDQQCADLFWQCLEAWDQQNPYGTTVNWACGQESSFRCFAWVFAACCFCGSAHTTSIRLHRLTELIWYTGRHVSENIIYARSQKNNHAISEAVCLWMIGLLFPELKEAARWRIQGERILRAEVTRQVYADGSYVQHSLNYHRVMLDDLCWAASVARAAGLELPAWLRDPMQRAADWLYDMVSPATGLAPNYGANDGAFILPLSCCDYRDYRPVVQTAHALLGRPPAYPCGAWNEGALWLSPAARQTTAIAPAPHSSATTPASTAKAIGGYFLLRGPRSQGMIRCHSYKDRPSQCDMLHFDLSYDGDPLLRDAGSYSYYTNEPWQSWFYSTAAHNTIQVDSQDQMIKGPRFLWLRWTRSQLLHWRSASDGRADYFRGRHLGYTRLPGKVVHERTILRADDSYLVIDEVVSDSNSPNQIPHEIALRWRLRPADWKHSPVATSTAVLSAAWTAVFDHDKYQIQLIAPPDASCALACGVASPAPEGWESLYYAEKTPAPTLIARLHASLPVRFLTLIAPSAAGLRISAVDHAGSLLVAGGPPLLNELLQDCGETRILHQG